MKTAGDWLEYCEAEMTSAGLFFGHGTNNARDESAWLVLHVLSAPLDVNFDQWDIELDEIQQLHLEQLLVRRINERCPMAYLTGGARFCGLDFIVTPDVLVPRSPLAEMIPEQFSPWLDISMGGRVMDMCTGGACIAIAMAMHMPGVIVDAVDISHAALEVAAQNVARHHVEGRVNLLHSDLFSTIGDENYDLIVSNPPYVSEAVFERLPAEYLAEPSSGLVCGEDGLDIVLKILDASAGHMKENGILIVEVGESAEALAELLPGMPFLWLDFQHGGDGIFLLEYKQLIAGQPEIRAVLEQRENV